jgi:hypothetical protein
VGGEQFQQRVHERKSGYGDEHGRKTAEVAGIHGGGTIREAGVADRNVREITFKY